MSASTQPKIIYLLFCLGLICFAPLVVLPPAPTQAMLPPRYTPTPEPDDDHKSSPVGAYIQLQVEATEVWTIVQWQDSAGNWQDVEGWQGSPDPDGRKTWWVASHDFNKGPFRWVVYQGQQGTRLGVTDLFQLPSQAGETKIVYIPLGE